MKILHVDLQERGSNSVEFRFFWDNPNQNQPATRSLSEIENLSSKADTDYYTRLPEDHSKTGKALYRWLDGSERILQNELDRHGREGIVLAISTSQGLAHLPWELLHDGQSFLVSKLPAIVPVRWVKTGNERLLTLEDSPKDRALNVLFMASAARGVEPELDFEAEEGKILEATRKRPLSLTVEESGCLEELCELVKSKKEKGHFDVIHLTGHATFEDDKPCFITETEYGDRKDTSAEDIARGLQFNLPKLIFLSGCRTGYSSKDEILSMAEELLKLGAKAVLGWGQNVKDSDASLAAAKLYEELATGSTLSESLVTTYQELLKCQARDWHCLRLYVTGAMPEALVTRGNKPLPPPSIVDEFIDPDTRKLRVANRETFVGRRRELQNCLQVLKTQSSRKAGVLIQGMGGNGKSTIAARLCDRLSEDEKLVWWRQVDETSLVDKLADKLENREQRIALKNNQDELKYRLRDTFRQLKRPFLLIFDDFEWNLEYRGNQYVLKSDIVESIKALVWAIQETNYYHRIIITCRYEFDSEIRRTLYHLPSLRSLSNADLQKKLRRLDKFNSGDMEESYLQRALKLADGNPRLLEWLNKDVLSVKDIDGELIKYESSSDSWRDKIIWQLEAQPKLETDENLEKVIIRCLIYEVPVPLNALEAVCQSVPEYQEKLKQARQRGLIEESPEATGEKLYRASHIRHINPFIELPQDEKELLALSRIAHQQIDHLWANKENKNEERWAEIFRLAFADKENSDRFREQFTKMISVQYNSEADRAYEKELRKEKEYLMANQEQIYQKLEEYLRQKDWKKADYETALIMYQWMVIENYDDFYDLFRGVPLKEINEIDRLWMQYSNQQFGIKGQAKIYRDLGGTEEYNYEIWNRFGDRVGWKQGEQWLKLNEVAYRTTETHNYHLPVLLYCRYFGWVEQVLLLNMDGWSALFSRVET